MRIEKTKLRVLVADDNSQFRSAIVDLLRSAFDVVGEVSTGRELVHAAIALGPDVIVSDLEMPLLSGSAAMKELHGAGHLVPIVLLTASAQYARTWLQMGALAVVDKSDLHDDLIAAVQSAAAGRSYLSRKARTV